MSLQRTRIAWQDGDEGVQRWVEKWCDGDPETQTEVLHETDRRVVYRIESPNELELDSSGKPSPRSIVVKLHRTHSGPHRRREAIKRKVGFSPPLREWRALCELDQLGLRVPEPLAWGRLPNGDAFVVTGFCEGMNAARALDQATPESRQRIMKQLLAAVRTLHEAGFRHGDLHLGNLLVGEDEVYLLDVQRARSAKPPREQLRDLAQLDLSLARAGFPVDLRRPLRAQLKTTQRLDGAARRLNRDFMRGRGRKQLRVGVGWVETRIDTLHGRIDQRYALSEVRRAIAFARAQPRPERRQQARSRIDVYRSPKSQFIVKRTESRSRVHALVDAFRGTPATRAFRRGQKLNLLGEIGARPVAAFDDRGERPARTSWLVLEHVGSMDLDAYEPESETIGSRCLTALADWVADWQASGIDHLDLKAGNIRVDASGPQFRFWLVDLVDVRFRRRLSDRARRRSLVQLNASLADAAFSARVRRSALEAYRSRLPIGGRDRESMIRSIASQSLARNHRWKGKGCRALPSEEIRD